MFYINTFKDMSQKKLCKYSKECLIYKGEEESKSLSVWMYKNIFCTRGEMGWESCDRFVEFESRGDS